MKNQILGFAILMFIYSNAYADITVINQSDIPLYFASSRDDLCSGACDIALHGGGKVWTCCGDTAGQVLGKNQTGTIGMHAGAPSWTIRGWDYPVTAYKYGGGRQQTKSNVGPDDTVVYPGDFDTTKGW